MPNQARADDPIRHDPVARYCIEVGIAPNDALRDDVRCPACDEMRELLKLDPDFAEEMQGYDDPPAQATANA